MQEWGLVQVWVRARGVSNVRTRGKEKTEDMATAEFVEKIKKLISEKSPTL